MGKRSMTVRHRQEWVRVKIDHDGEIVVTAGHSKFVSASAYLSVAAAKRLRDGLTEVIDASTPAPTAAGGE